MMGNSFFGKICKLVPGVALWLLGIVSSTGCEPIKIRARDDASVPQDARDITDVLPQGFDVGPSDGHVEPDANPDPDGGVFISGSRLGVHVLSGCNSCVQTLIDGCPRIVKFLAGEGSECIARYRQNCGPNGVVVLRVFVSHSVTYSASWDPAVAAQDFWGQISPHLAGIDPTQVDWLEGPNELDNTQDWYHNYGEAQFFAAFWSHLADIMHQNGWNPLVGSVAAGNPTLAGEGAESPDNYMQPLADVILSKTYPIAWAYHSYSPDLDTDVAMVEIWYSLRYRTIRDETGLQGVPLILSEGGQDIPTGWLGQGTSPADYVAWLQWFDAQMALDPEVVGVTLFQAGNTGDWSDFDICPITSELVSIFATPP